MASSDKMNRNDNRSVKNIVGVVASAGGLEATSLLARSLPQNQNCCYVITQHMSPTHKSMLVQLLSRETKLRVEELEQRTFPEPNVIYVPPPGYDVICAEGAFLLREPAGHYASPKPSGDRLLISLAEEIGERAIGIVLSGTGSDGSYGIQAIREAGGITIAQEPSSCKYDSMPHAAIRTGCIDLVLMPQQIGAHLSHIMEHPRDLSMIKELAERGSKNRDLFDILLSHTLVDFRQYKDTTIHRRIERRMVAKGIDDFDDYVDLCRRSVEEVEALYGDLLISVTRFFRDPEQFEALGVELKRLITNRKTDAPVRIWVAGCATGEEAYTIGILAAEAMGGLDEVDPDAIQIFATDIDEAALNRGRKGVFPLSAVNDIPSAYVEKYFDINDDSLIVKQKLRRFVMFSRHNVFQDAPFINVDLVSLRNVLIYFNSRLQERVLTRAAYALVPNGLLMLGTSETLGAVDMQFTQTVSHARIYRKEIRQGSTQMPVGAKDRWPTASARLAEGQTFSPSTLRSNNEWRYFDRLAESIVTNGVLVNRERVILRVYGDIAPFCALTAVSLGQASLTMLRKPLASDAASLSLVALKYGEARDGQWHDLSGGPEGQQARISAYPLTSVGEETTEDLVLLGFKTGLRQEPASADEEKSDYVAYLEDELTRTRDALQVTIEQLQTSNEELQALNEELQSSNEELQSTNEELETSNEELQSTNEELITVNEELLVNSGQLERTSAEVMGLIDSMPAPTVMVDQGLMLRYASKTAMTMFSLSERGTGFGHLSQVNMPYGMPDLVSLCSTALVQRKPVTTLFRDSSLQSHQLRIMPISGNSDALVGLVLQFDLVSEMAGDRQINEKLRALSDYAVWRTNLTTGQSETSQKLSEILGREGPETNISMDDAFARIDEKDRARIKEILSQAAEDLSAFEYYVRIPRGPQGKGDIIVAHVIGEAVQDPETNDIILFGLLKNASEEWNRNLLIRHYNIVARARGIGFYSYDIANDLPYWSPSLYEVLGYPADQPPTIEMGLAVFDAPTRERVEALLGAAIQAGKPYDYEEVMTRPNGTKARVHGAGHLAKNDAGEVTHVFGSFEILEELGSE
ncbi:chemotaxis protein CheB [Tropicibacter naphthalenivorans]|uniref:protein-glutamate O-methyltransferase n=1 Tax=Tropicibacter naphthalenivorans TaxID=441103 RepID=A0A0P1GII7_9RHOB|nr:chemotaxis protein CheB [Tropicibacter naphthalenivorans]CUH81668.1 Chemotaxis protein methyltransferase [Tropicibacter naphthalenivorans]SMC99387.1 two-component system, chemotaxis family, CheB/CheR fusion protein [Tropicibacter naphthalenivorans]